jgi:TPR repeat protein
MKRLTPIRALMLSATCLFSNFMAVHQTNAQTNWSADLSRAEAALKGKTVAPSNPLLVPDVELAREILIDVVRNASITDIAKACGKLLPILDKDDPEIRETCEKAAKETGSTEIFTKSVVQAEPGGQTGQVLSEDALRLLQAALANGSFKAALALSRQPNNDPKVSESYRKQAGMLALRNAATEASAAIYVDTQTILQDGSKSAVTDAAWLRLTGFASTGSREAVMALRDIGQKLPAVAPRAAKSIFEASQAGNADAAQVYVAAHVDDRPVWTETSAAERLATQLVQTGRTIDLVVALQFSIRNGGSVTVADIGKRIAVSAKGNVTELLRAAWRLEETRLATPSELVLAFELAEEAALKGNAKAAYWAPLLIEQHPDIAGDGRWERAIKLLEQNSQPNGLDHAILSAKLKLAHPSGTPDLKAAQQILETIEPKSRTALVWNLLAGISAKDNSVAAGKKTADLYGQAIKLGSVDAMIELATLLLSGRPGISADPTTAQRLLDDAAASGQTEAMLKLAKAVTAFEPEQAKVLYTKALQSGDARAGLGLSTLLESKGDLKAARKALEQAAALGNPEMIAAFASFLFRTKSQNPQEIERILEPIISAKDINSSAQVLAASTMLQLNSPRSQGQALRVLEDLAGIEDADATAALARYHVGIRITGSENTNAEIWAQKASKLQRPAALVELAKWHLQSEDRQLQRKAVELLSDVVKSNPSQSDANRLLGDVFAQGDMVNRDVTAAFRHYEAAALAGSVGGQVRLARAYEAGGGTPQDTAKAIEFYTKAADAGSLNAMRDLGRLFVSDGPYSDPVRGFQLLYTAAKAGQVQSQTEVGRLLLSGVGVLHDEQEGLRWLLRGVQGGDTGAMIDLFHHYRRNGGTAKQKDAIALLEKAASTGSKEAMSILATMYRDGDLVQADQKLAQLWFKKAADQGDLKAARASKRLTKKIGEKQ